MPRLIWLLTREISRLRMSLWASLHVSHTWMEVGERREESHSSHLLITVSTWVDIGLLLTDGAPGGGGWQESLEGEMRFGRGQESLEKSLEGDSSCKAEDKFCRWQRSLGHGRRIRRVIQGLWWGQDVQKGYRRFLEDDISFGKVKGGLEKWQASLTWCRGVWGVTVRFQKEQKCLER